MLRAIALTDGVRLLLEKIRGFLVAHGLDGLIVSHADEYLGEYLTPDKQRLKAVTGFTGSAGLAIILPQTAVLFTDSRYTAQAKKQTDFQVFEVPSETTPLKWLEKNGAGKQIAFQSKTHSYAWYELAQKELVKADITLVPLRGNVVDLFWTDRPEPVKAKTKRYPENYAGEKTQSKLKRIGALLREKRLEATLVCNPESISRLLNKRGFSNPMCPVFFERGVVFADDTYAKLTPLTLRRLFHKKIAIDFRVTPFAIYNQVAALTRHIHNMPDIVAELKAIKNATEIQNLKEACLFESAVICRFLGFVETHKGRLEEIQCAQELQRLRSENPLYVSDSFDAIVAAGPHATLAHYLPDENSSALVGDHPLLLVDTGGQYWNGTTDMTRTICVGKPTELMKRRYTQVLKGHIALAIAILNKGEMPCEIDAKVHSFLRADGADYAHATGHGIGMFLSVHESPPTIHEKSKTPIASGMVFSNEPACYDEENGFGIRLENMLLAVPKNKEKIAFENLLFIPFDGRVIDFKMLTVSEKNWLKKYHERIVQEVFPRLDKETCRILQPLIDFFV